MSGEIPMCPLYQTPRTCRGERETRGCWGWQNYPTCTAPTTATPPVPQNLKILLLKQQTQSNSTRVSQRRDVATSWSSLGQMARERDLRVSCVEPSSTTRARLLEPAKPIQRRLMTRREDAPFQPDGGGTHRTGPGAGRHRRRQDIAGGQPM